MARLSVLPDILECTWGGGIITLLGCIMSMSTMSTFCYLQGESQTLQVCIDILAIIKHLLMDVDSNNDDIVDVPELFVPRG